MSVLSVAEERFLLLAKWRTNGIVWFDPETLGPPVQPREAVRIQLERVSARAPRVALPDID